MTSPDVPIGLQRQAYEPFDRDAVAKWMRSMPPSFREWLDMEFNQTLGYLRSANDVITICRYQGKLDVLDQFRHLREEA
jgi:hypothetical protein